MSKKDAKTIKQHRLYNVHTNRWILLTSKIINNKLSPKIIDFIKKPSCVSNYQCNTFYK